MIKACIVLDRAATAIYCCEDGLVAGGWTGNVTGGRYAGEGRRRGSLGSSSVNCEHFYRWGTCCSVSTLLHYRQVVGTCCLLRPGRRCMAPSAWRHRHLLVSVWPPVSGHQSKKKGCAIVSMSPCPAAVLGQGSQAGWRLQAER